MEDSSTLVGLAGMAAAGLALFSAAVLKAWAQWLELRRAELSVPPTLQDFPGASVADLRRRVRRLEAIAEGSEA